MKKILVFLVAIFMCFVITGCSNNDSNETVSNEEYTLEQLQDMALDYYEMKNDYRPQYAAAIYDENNADMVVIQLYDSFDTHNSTSDWYTVDKYTAIGTDISENEIDLKEALEE